jgi:hypothetical protein
MVIRFTPTEPGQWDFRITSNLQTYNGKTGQLAATESESPGFVRTANVHHFAYTERNIPHLWMGSTLMRFGLIDDAAFRSFADRCAADKFTHVRGIAIGGPEDMATAFPTPDAPAPAYFRQLDERMRYLNQKGLVVDLLLAGGANSLTKLFPAWEQRERFIRYLIARYSAFNITWGGVENFEDYENARDLLKEIGLALKKEDPYSHLRSTGARASSAPLLEDGWMDFVTDESADDQLGAIEHQLYPVPFVNMAFAGKQEAANDAFRRRLWNATMNGQYVGTVAENTEQSAVMKTWFTFFGDNRHWELEPYFDVDGGRAVALEGIEYIVYVEKPGPVEVLVEKHGYDVRWFNPANGESVKLKDFKGERFAGEAPDNTHDWVLHIAREGRKEGMLKSYKFESRQILLQEVEVSPRKVPFDVSQPSGDLSLRGPIPFAVKVTRETRATRSMMYLWTGDVARDNQGYRILATGDKGNLQVPSNLARHLPAPLHVRVFGMNANGKLYSVDRTYQLNP